MLVIGEINADGQLVAAVTFDLDDIDDAFEELDARYVAGEAEAHGQTWSVIARTYTMFNRRVVPATDVVIIDHRRGTPFAPGDLTAAMRVSGDLTPDLAITSRQCIGSVISEQSPVTRRMGPRKRVSKPSGERSNF